MLLVLFRVISIRVMRVDHVLSQVWLGPEPRCVSRVKSPATKATTEIQSTQRNLHSQLDDVHCLKEDALPGKD